LQEAQAFIVVKRTMPLMTDYLLNYWRERYEANKWFPVYVLISFPFLILIIIHGIGFSNKDPSICQGCTTESRVGFFFIYSMTAYAISILPFAYALFLKNYRSLFSNHD